MVTMRATVFLFQAVECVLIPYLSRYWPRLQTVMDDPSCAAVKVDSQKIYGAILVSVNLTCLWPHTGQCK